MSITKPLMLDETGRLIAEALTQTEMTKNRIAEITEAAESAKVEIETKADEQVARIPEVLSLNEAVTQLKEDIADLDLGSIYTMKSVTGIVNSAGTSWINVNNNYAHVAIPVIGGEKIKAIGHTNKSYMIAVTEYDEESVVAGGNTHISTVDGWTLRKTIPNELTEYTVPNDAKYLIVLVKTSGDYIYPVKFEIDGYDYCVSAKEKISHIISGLNSVQKTVEYEKERCDLIGDSLSELYDLTESLDVMKDYYIKGQTTNNGITYSVDGNTINMYGIASNSSICNLYTEKMVIPNTLSDGLYDLQFNCPCESAYLRMFLYASGSVISTTNYYNGKHVVGIPKSCDSMLIRVQVPVGTEVDCDAVISWTKAKSISVHNKYKNAPKIIVFKDDDTSTNNAVQRYHDACRHNGIYGNFCIIPYRIEEGYTDVNYLLDYEVEGFGIIAHAYQQGGVDYWNTHDTAQRRNDLKQLVSKLREYGFINPFSCWQYPGGNIDTDAITMCKDFGFRTLGTQSVGASTAVNRIENLSRYDIKTNSMRESDTAGSSGQTLAEAKKCIDNLVNSCGGLLVLTTHFNTWDSLEYDTAQDENGYPIGYARFNELAQYAIASGCEIMTMARAVETLDKYFID